MAVKIIDKTQLNSSSLQKVGLTDANTHTHKPNQTSDFLILHLEVVLHVLSFSFCAFLSFFFSPLPSLHPSLPFPCRSFFPSFFEVVYFSVRVLITGNRLQLLPLIMAGWSLSTYTHTLPMYGYTRNLRTHFTQKAFILLQTYGTELLIQTHERASWSSSDQVVDQHTWYQSWCVYGRGFGESVTVIYKNLLIVCRCYSQLLSIKEARFSTALL